MPSLAARFSVIVVVALATLGLATTQKSKVVAHEWGTFTTVAGADGRAVEWIPLGGPVDLPCFVNVFGADGDPLRYLVGKVAGVQIRIGQPVTVIQIRNPITGAVLTGTPVPPVPGAPVSIWSAPNRGALLTYDQARAQLRGTVRMETPVIYFYSPREDMVSVGVEFPRGFMSEWYPAALVNQPEPQHIPLDSNLSSTIMWKNVAILPGTSPALKTEAGKSHYYAARETDANPIRVNGQDEKFLFYRGVGGFQVPLNATEMSNGNISVKNTGKVPVPAVVLFENRDGKVGYRVHSALSGETQLKPVPLTGDLASLGRDLETMLVAAGMYKKEAHAMVETWRDSWFEEGTRLFYIMPSSSVDEVLPLAIVPAPEKIERAFVGRLEIITKETVRRVATALETENEEMLLRYGRFLGPITDRMMEGASPATIENTKKYVNGLFAAFVERTEKKCK